MIPQNYIDVAFANVLSTLGRSNEDKYAKMKLMEVKLELEKIKSVYFNEKKRQ